VASAVDVAVVPVVRAAPVDVVPAGVVPAADVVRAVVADVAPVAVAGSEDVVAGATVRTPDRASIRDRIPVRPPPAPARVRTSAVPAVVRAAAVVPVVRAVVDLGLLAVAVAVAVAVAISRHKRPASPGSDPTVSRCRPAASALASRSVPMPMAWDLMELLGILPAARNASKSATRR